MLVFEERGKRGTPGKSLSLHSREPTNSTHIWRRVRESNSGPHWWEASALTTATSLHNALFSFYYLIYFLLLLLEPIRSLSKLRTTTITAMRMLHKTTALMNKNNGIVHPARRFIFWCIFSRFLSDNDVNWPNLSLCRGRENPTIHFNFLPCKQLHRSYQFYSWNVDTQFPCRATWNNCEMSTIRKRNWNFKWLSRILN